MTVEVVPYVEQNLSHSAALFRQAFASGWTSGGVCAAGELLVSAQSSPNMSVQVAAGRAIIPGTNVTPPSGFGFTTQGDYFVLNDGTISVTVSAANATNPRIDVVYVGVQDSYYSGSTNTALVGIVTGTPAPTPSIPAIPTNAVLLALVAVAANATSIVAGNITYEPPIAASIASPSQGLTLINPASVVGGTVSALGAVSFASATSVSLNGVFSSLFDNYRVVLKYAPTSTGVPLLRLRSGGSDDPAANYGYQLLASSSGSVSAAVGTSSTSFELTSATASSKFLGFLDLFSPFLADSTGFLADIQSYSSISSATGMAWEKSSGAHGPAVSKDGFTLFTGAGTMTGTLRVYGYNNG